ncbi:alpha/beta hydrolase [Paraburkholderia dipogonis]|uniref:alpha/beta hydrolase n=1 Tax=Paraburkholderia dipogonis TaxID=1211383 RepID=UPI0035E7D840
MLVHDASFQGASGGTPRFIEDPSIRVSDIRFAIDYLQSLPYVDASRIGAIGVCGGGAYTVHAGITDHRIKALVSITGVNYGRLIREGFANFKPHEFIENMAAMRTAEAQGGERHVANLLPDSVEAGKKAGIDDIDVLEATEYYKTARGQQPNGATSQLMSFSSAAMGWDAFLNAEVLLTQPLLVVIGDKPGGFWRLSRRLGDLRTRRLEEQADRCGRGLVALRFVRQNRKPVGIAMAKVVPFFKETL